MSHDDRKGTPSPAQDVQSSSHELGANALPLVVRMHGHRSQSHSGDAPLRTFDLHRCEENVTHDGAIVRNQR